MPLADITSAVFIGKDGFLPLKKDAVKETIRPETAKKRLCLYKHGKAGWYRGIISSLQRKLQGLFIFIRKVFLLNIKRSAEYHTAKERNAR